MGPEQLRPPFLILEVGAVVWRQLLFPVVLLHSGMLPKNLLRNVTEQSAAPDHWIIAFAEPEGSAVSVANRAN
jgi:hypothetical protein